MEEAEELAETIQAHLNDWRDAPENINILTALQRDLHTFKGGARMAELRPIGDLAHELESLYERLADGRLTVSADKMKLAASCQDRLQDMVHDIVERQGCQPAPDLLNALHLEIYGEPLAQSEASDDTDDVTVLPAFDNDFVAKLDLSNELLAIFIDEAQELNKQLTAALQSLQQDHGNLNSVDECKRILHTLKGGARVANLDKLGQFYHDLESELVARTSGNRDISADFVAALISEHDLSAAAIDQVRQQVTADVPVEPQVPEVPKAKPASKRTGPDLQQPKQAEKRAQPQETVRVQADLLENLVNLAGETSISRARLEEQVSEFGFTLEEMEATISRLREQVRRLDAETEAQVSFRQEQVAEMGQEEFDPLEMDRYSTIQQLSRALLESASDIFDLKASLVDKSRDAETVLVQQSRINTELQEGLMQTRMVPFSRMLPRLRRVVRQIAAELGKQVELQTRNADGELDRQVLERLVAPLEHMLRNAIDHGIELPSNRAAQGKPEMGTITIEIAREGGDVVLNISDDGQGINTDAIRRKGIERGMIEADAELTQEELLQLLMTAGFSTAESVTQISGRGVGLDVVASEIRQLGGSVELYSEPQIGTNFLLRIPFTVSVNRALMVGIGEELYALPLNTIEGIVRVPEEELMAHMKASNATYHYGGQDYRIRYLGDVLGTGHNPRLDNNGLPLPVVLIKGRHAGDHIAVHVDELLGSREIVVKSIGPQFAQVAGLSGATILGDGRVVVIIDLATLARTEQALLQQEPERNALTDQNQTKARSLVEDEQYTVMVVDDSVTVRKVTTRLLERNGYKAVVAKDGADALLTLQDTIPDLMLLDIEMPRMDGFELATRMRHDERLSHVPIIMITSRTGSKHRDRALAIGVNEYMGKPFQEAALLENIKKQLAIAETLV
ncbi:response regulator [Salinibius halmophilus]|uniref:response regulator n=1 Tax=Salinibius halmophilus TaxID=1853216 RepID=UPI000E6721FB|nr:response regulator [Salinibius halmophilus]